MRDQDDVAADLEALNKRAGQNIPIPERANLTRAERALLREAAQLLRKIKTRGAVDML